MIVKKDWAGNSKSTFKCIGASNHTDFDREINDYYATDPKCGRDLIALVPELKNIWECACGEGHLSKEFGDKLVKSSDLVDRGFGKVEDFLGVQSKWIGDIVTNPPYKYGSEFLLKAIDLLQNGNFYCAFLKLTFLEGKSRREIFNKYPPKYVYVYSSRQKCAINGDFNKAKSSAICYAWFIWQKGFCGNTILKWI